MDYERIHKVQTGMISPSKLRIRLLGGKKKDGSTSNSSRTSPSRMDDAEFVKNSLLLSPPDGDFGSQVSSPSEDQPTHSDPAAAVSEICQGNTNLLQQPKIDNLVLREISDAAGRLRTLQTQPGAKGADLADPHRYEDENLDYDSTSSFEFHKGERSLHHSLSRTLARPMPSKWNDAEKWIMNKQSGQTNMGKKNNVQQNQGNWPSTSNMVKVAPEALVSDYKASVKRVDFVQPPQHVGPLRSGFLPHEAAPTEGQDLTDVDDDGLLCTKSVTEENKGVPMVRSVSMRDMGTEMTPIPSQEPSRSATPQTATTPLRSPTSSMPSTPRRGEPAPSPTEFCITSNPTQNSGVAGKKEMSEQELKMKTRKEIMALGVQLGKLNIAAWASKDEKDKSVSGSENAADENECAEYAKRAAAWEEAELAKHAARFKREEIRIQAWEGRQKAKLESAMRKIEAQIEQMRAHAQAKMAKKMAVARQKSEKKRAAAEAHKNKMAEKTVAQAEYIRQTGRLPSFASMCCGW